MTFNLNIQYTTPIHVKISTAQLRGIQYIINNIIILIINNNNNIINHDCLPILMLLYIMLYIVLAYLMLFAALTNAVCLYNASFFCH